MCVLILIRKIIRHDSGRGLESNCVRPIYPVNLVPATLQINFGLLGYVSVQFDSMTAVNLFS